MEEENNKQDTNPNNSNKFQKFGNTLGKNWGNEKVPDALKNAGQKQRMYTPNASPNQESSEDDSEQENNPNEKSDLTKNNPLGNSPNAKEKIRQESKDKAQKFLDKKTANKNPLTRKLIKSQADKLIDKAVDSKSAQKNIERISKIVDVVDTVQKIKKIGILTAKIVALGWPIILGALVGIIGISMIFLAVDEIAKGIVNVRTGYEVVLNFLKMEGVGTNEDYYYNTLHHEAAKFDSRPNKVGQLDIALITSTTHYEQYLGIKNKNGDDVWSLLFNDDWDNMNFYLRKKDDIGIMSQNDSLVGILVSKKGAYECGKTDALSSLNRYFTDVYSDFLDFTDGFLNFAKTVLNVPVQLTIGVPETINKAALNFDYYETGDAWAETGEDLAKWITLGLLDYDNIVYSGNELVQKFLPKSFFNELNEEIRATTDEYQKLYDDLKATCEEDEDVVVVNKYYNDYTTYKHYLINRYIPKNYMYCNGCQYKKGELTSKEHTKIATKMADEIFSQKDAFNEILGVDPEKDSKGSGLTPPINVKRIGSDGIMVNDKSIPIYQYISHLIERDYNALEDEQKKAMSVIIRTRLAKETDNFNKGITDESYVIGNEANQKIASSTSEEVIRKDKKLFNVPSLDYSEALTLSGNDYIEMITNMFDGVVVEDINQSDELIKDEDTGYYTRYKSPSISRTYTNPYFYGKYYDSTTTYEGECPWYATSRMREFYQNQNIHITGSGSSICNSGQTQMGAKFEILKGNSNVNNVKEGDLVSWNWEDFGHVAFVEKVNKDASGKLISIIITESYNNLGSGFIANTGNAYLPGTNNRYNVNDIFFRNDTDETSSLIKRYRRQNCSGQVISGGKYIDSWDDTKMCFKRSEILAKNIKTNYDGFKCYVRLKSIN